MSKRTRRDSPTNDKAPPRKGEERSALPSKPGLFRGMMNYLSSFRETSSIPAIGGLEAISQLQSSLPPWQRVRKALQIATATWALGRRLLVGSLSIVVIYYVFFILLPPHLASRFDVLVDSVPKSLVENGDTQDIIAVRFADQMDRIARPPTDITYATGDASDATSLRFADEQAGIAKSPIELAYSAGPLWGEFPGPRLFPADAPRIALPWFGLHVDELLAPVRRIMSIEHHHIGIAIESNASGNHLYLRIDGGEAYGGSESFPVDNLDEMLRDGAMRVYSHLMPHLYAAALYPTEPQRALAVSSRIIDTFEDSNVSVKWAHHIKGVVYRDRYQMDSAEAESRKAIILDENEPIFHIGLAVTLGSGVLDRRNESIEEFRKALRLSPQNVVAHVGLGLDLKYSGRLSEAASEFKTAIQIDPHHGGAYADLSNCYRDLGNRVEARQVLLDGEVAANGDAVIANNIGNLLEEEGKHEEAQREYRRALFLRPSYASPHKGLGDIYSYQEKWEEATGEYRMALRLVQGTVTLPQDPKRAGAYYDIARALMRGKTVPTADAAVMDEACSDLLEATRRDIANQIYRDIRQSIANKSDGKWCASN